MPSLEEPRTSPGTKLRTRNTRLVIGCVSAIATAVVTGFFEWRSRTVEEKATVQVQQVDAAGLERLVKLEQKLVDHIDAENRRNDTLDKRFDRSERRSAMMDAKLDIELDHHGVPKNRRPQVEDFEPAGPPGESP